MGLTRVDVEGALIGRAGRKMELVGFSINPTGGNEALNDPLATALLDMGYTVSNLANVTDTDLAAVENINELLDRAELRLMENIAGNFDLVNISVGGRSESLGSLAQQVDGVIQRLEKKIERLYGGLGSLTAGVVSLDFAQEIEPGEDLS